MNTSICGGTAVLSHDFNELGNLFSAQEETIDRKWSGAGARL